MRAVWFRWRAELRYGWRGIVVLALLAGMFSGVVLTSLAGARRTQTAVDRLVTSGWVATAFVDAPEGSFPAVEAIPEVRDYIEAAFTFAGPWIEGRGNSAGFSVSSQSIIGGRDLSGGIMLSGRVPDRARPDEVLLSERAARILHAHVGTVFPVEGFTSDQIDAVFRGAQQKPKLKLPRVRVTGIIRLVTDLPAMNVPVDVQWVGSATLFFTPAWFKLHGAQVGHFAGIIVRLKRGTADVESFRAHLDAATHGEGHAFVGGSDDEVAATQARRGTDVAAFALLLFSIVGALALILIIGQAVARQIAGCALDFPTLRAIGMQRGQLVALLLARVIAIAIAGVAAGVPIAIASSSLMPIGLARNAEVHPGVSLDAPVVLGGAGVIVVLLVIAAVVPVVRAARSRGGGGSASTSHVAGLLARSGMAPTAVSGVRLALEPGRGSSAVPVRSTIASTSLALAALVAAAVFGTSLGRLADRPSLQGWTWDVAVGNPHSPDLTKDVLPKLRAIPGVRAIAGDALADASDATVDGHPTTVIGWSAIQGVVPIHTLAGRAPSGDEVALGGKELRALRKRIGDSVDVSAAGGKPLRLRIAGQIVISPWAANDQVELGGGAVIPMDTLRRMAPEVPTNLFLVRADAAAIPAIRAAFPSQTLGAVAPTDVQNLQGVGGFPFILSVVLIALAVATIAHTLVSSVRRRRRELALLKTLGFVRRQVRTTVAWQAMTIMTIALILGSAAGIAGGRWAWILYAQRSAISPAPVVPVALVAILVPAGLLVANLIAAIPARTAARTQPALVLRTEG